MKGQLWHLGRKGHWSVAVPSLHDVHVMFTIYMTPNWSGIINNTEYFQLFVIIFTYLKWFISQQLFGLQKIARNKNTLLKNHKNAVLRYPPIHVLTLVLTHPPTRTWKRRYWPTHNTEIFKIFTLKSNSRLYKGMLLNI